MGGTAEAVPSRRWYLRTRLTTNPGNPVRTRLTTNPGNPVQTRLPTNLGNPVQRSPLVDVLGAKPRSPLATNSAPAFASRVPAMRLFGSRFTASGIATVLLYVVRVNN